MIEMKRHPLMDLEEVASIISDSLREGKMGFLPRRVSAEVEAADNSIEVTFCRPWYLRTVAEIESVGEIEHLVTKVKIVFNLDKRNKGGKKVPYLSAMLYGIQLCGKVLPLAECGVPYSKEAISIFVKTIAQCFSENGDMISKIVDRYGILGGLRENGVTIKVHNKYLLQMLLYLFAKKRITAIPLEDPWSKATPENIEEGFSTHNSDDWYLPSQAKLSVGLKSEDSAIRFHIKKQLESTSRVEVGSIAVEPRLDTMEDVAEFILQHHQAE